MKHILLLALFSFTFVDQSMASNGCFSLFGMFQRAPTFAPSYDYNPRNADQIVEALLKDRTLEKILRADFKKHHIPFFENYVREARSVLMNRRLEFSKGAVRNLADDLIDDIDLRMKNHTVTKEWILIFSSKFAAVIDGEPQSDFRRLQRMLAVRDAVLIPTFAKLDFEHFVELENKPVALIGMFEKPEYLDGVLLPFDAREGANHDFDHYLAITKDEKVMSPKHPDHKLWLSLHQEILGKIKQLPLNKRRYAEFIYFYTLREVDGFRDFFVQAHKRKILEQATQAKLRYEVIRSHYSGVPHGRVSINVVDLFNRMHRENDFKTAFPNKNPQEVLLVGLDSFFNILAEIDSGR